MDKRIIKIEKWDEGLPLGNGNTGSLVYDSNPLKITVDKTDLWDLNEKIKCLIVGCGHRSRLYAENAMNISKDFEIVGIVDPDEHILNLYADKYRVPKNMRFKNID